jgi:hypothetical protein
VECGFGPSTKTQKNPDRVNQQATTMGRKSKQAGGNLPLTHYERSKKFKAATSETVASISQYQLGQCALTTQNLLASDNDNAASVSKTTNVLCSPSGYLYEESALLEYLLRNTRELKRQRTAYETQERQSRVAETAQASEQRLVEFSTSQAIIIPTTTTKMVPMAAADTAKALTKVSYWLDSPEVSAPAAVRPPLRDRPGSPTTGVDVKRKDFWPVALQQNKSGQLICALSDKPILMSNVVAYWTTSDSIGTVALESIFGQLTTMTTTNDDDGNADDDPEKKKQKKKQTRRRCPLTDQQGTTVQRIERPGLGAK